MKPIAFFRGGSANTHGFCFKKRNFIFFIINIFVKMPIFGESLILKSFMGFSFKEKGFGFKNPMIFITKESLY